MSLQERTADETLTAAFGRVVRQHGDRIALVSDHGQSTYRELNATANRLAHALLRLGGDPGDRIAILMKDGARVVTAMVAILKAERIVVVLNVRDPAVRLRQLLDDADPICVLTDADCHGLAADLVAVERIVRFDQKRTEESDDDPAPSAHPQQVALLTYTSGSTAIPKAVMKTHRQLGRTTLVQTEAMSYSQHDRMPLFGSLSGGQAATMTWCALLNGATLYPYSIAFKGIDGLPDWIERAGLTVYVSSASIFRSLSKILPDGFKFSRVRAVRLSSEAVTADDFQLYRKHFTPECAFVHTLSSSETSNIAVSRHRWHDDFVTGVLPVGLPSMGGEVLLMGDDGRTVAPGEIGEIVVRSRYVAQGYWRNPELTAERFSDVLDEAGTREVRTGDMARINERGLLEFCGRRDNRVKIRGNRVELSEIEIALRRLPGVVHSAVEVVDRTGQNAMLVGFVAVSPDSRLTPARLRTELRAVLPPYMVPPIFVMKEAMPFTPSGKIDRQLLRQELPAIGTSAATDRPSTETESKLAAFWAGAFERDGIGVHEDFFDLGGDSLIAAIIAAKVHEAFGVEFDLALVADHPTIAQQAVALDRRSASEGRSRAPIVALPRNGPAPMSLSQEHWWRASQTAEQTAHQTTCMIYRITGTLDADALRDSLDYLSRRHEIFRTTFVERDGKPVQIVHPPEPLPMPVVDLSGEDDPETKARAIAADEAVRPIDAARLPLIRFVLVRLRDREHWLLRTGHHILFDGVQWWSAYWPELARLYEARVAGEPVPLPAAAPIQFSDYAIWERNHHEANRESYASEIAWWESLLLTDPQPPALPARRKQPVAGLDPNEGLMTWGVAPEASRRLNELGRAEGATYYMVRLAAFSAFLIAETGNANMVIGTYVSGFNRVGLRSTFGNFADLAPMVLRWQGEATFREWLGSVRRRVLDIQSNQRLPFEMLRREMESRHVPLTGFPVLVNAAAPAPPLRFAGLELTRLDRAVPSMRPGFAINFVESQEADGCRLAFDAGVYDPAEVRAMIARLVRVLEDVSLSPDKPLEAILQLPMTKLITKIVEQSEARRATLLASLQASEADRAARLDVIRSLSSQLEASETDRAARLQVIQTLSAHQLHVSRTDRAARRYVGGRLLAALDRGTVARLRQLWSSLRTRAGRRS